MTKSEALFQFFNKFGTAYPVTSVPDDVVFPWITYENKIGNVGDTISIAVNLWFHTDSEAIPNDKAEQIAFFIGLGGTLIPCDDGAIWIKRGTPWMQPINDENDNSIKGRMLTVDLEFL